MTYLFFACASQGRLRRADCGDLASCCDFCIEINSLGWLSCVDIVKLFQDHIDLTALSASLPRDPHHIIILAPLYFGLW